MSECPVSGKQDSSGCPVQHNSTETSTPSTIPTTSNLSNQRQTSSIPNTKGGFWIYPSEQLFFNALNRKNQPINPQDLKTIIPVHNIVNEKCWEEIKKWEGLNSSCTTPKLVSFIGDAGKLSPKAFFWSLLGYKRPFDRHDWVIDRCGEEIVYVIDFYRGKNSSFRRTRFILLFGCSTAYNPKRYFREDQVLVDF